MSHDTRNAGHARRRRQTLILLGAGGAALLNVPVMAQPQPACVVTPAQTAGPFFVDEQLNRADIRSDPATGVLRPGVPLILALRVLAVQASGCTPLAGALVDVWHCDAAGMYSGTGNVQSARFLRGQQVADTRGAVQFTTVYPGWYPGRAVHVHFKVRIPTAGGRALEFTSQIYFNEEVTDRVMTRAPYAMRDGRRRVRNVADGIYRDGGNQLMAKLTERDAVYAAVFDIGLHRS